MTYISVIIPTFNKSPLVCDVVRSLNQQTFKDFEIIVVDDGSTDNTIKSLKFMRRSERNLKIKVFNTYKTNEFGMCHAINLGLQKSRGIIAFLMNDDIYLHNRCLELHYMAHNSIGRRCAFLGPRLRSPPYRVGQLITGAGSLRHLYMKHTERREQWGYPVYRKRKMVSSNLSVNMDALCEVGGYNEFFGRYTGAIDRDVYYRLDKHGVPVLFLAQAQAYSVTYDYPLYRQTKWVLDNGALRGGVNISTWKRDQMRYSEKMELQAQSRPPKPIVRRIDK